MLTRARTSGPTAYHAATQTTTSRPPKKPNASRTPRGRQVCGSDGSETAGMDVGHQDAAGADGPELVHHPVGAGAGHHRTHRDPALAVQGRDRRTLDAGSQRDGVD